MPQKEKQNATKMRKNDNSVRVSPGAHRQSQPIEANEEVNDKPISVKLVKAIKKTRKNYSSFDGCTKNELSVPLHAQTIIIPRN